MTCATKIVLTSRARTNVARSECKSLSSLLAVGAVIVMSVLGLVLSASAHAANRSTLRSGRDVYRAACVGCHGAEGTGADRSLIGFEPPETFPDFTQCDQTTPEQNLAWKAMIRDGGPSRGFSQIMPAFGDALTDEQIDAVVGYLRSFCKDQVWPRGELNLPRALATEKAFPENETVLTSAFNAQHSPGIDSELGYEYRIGKRSQLEVAVPFSFAQRASGGLSGGIGDLALGLKQVLFSQLSPDAGHGSIFSLQGEIALPTGDKARGFGTGEAVFTTFGAYDVLFPGNAFLQMQGGVDLPRHTRDVPRTAFLRAAFGKTIAEHDGYGRAWSPMLELTGERDLQDGARTQWDVIPELQVTFSARQHVRADLGFRIPVTETVDRPRQVMLYVLWDWFDGGLQEGW
jgi:mono/diheme cytochrome c family protein